MKKISITKELEDWYAKFKYTFFSYKDGFFHMKFQSKSPQKMLDSFEKMPFVKLDKTKNVLTTNNPLMKVKINYFKFNEDLWLLISEMENRFNVFHRGINEKEEVDKEEGFSFLNLHLNKIDFSSKTMLLNGMPVHNNYWNILKPNASRSISYFKNRTEKNITLYFKGNLLDVLQINTKDIGTDALNHFFESQNQYLSSTDLIERDYFFKKLLNILSLKDESKKETLLLKEIKNFTNTFLDTLSNDNLSQNYFLVPDHDRKNILKVEEILQVNLMKSFPGITTLATEIGVSPTKLKADFKTVHNSSIFQFYRINQLNIAYSLLEKKSLNVKNIASLLGYENSSKFTTAFKNHFGVLPSSIT